jgi:hypothetical protein
MNYQDLRSRIKSGDLIAWSSSRGLQVNLIRIFTRCQYTHVGIAWVVDDRVFVIEAVPGDGVRVNPLSTHLPFYHVSNGSGVWTPEMERFALSKVGETYSKWEAILGFFGKTRNNGKWECAELVKETFAIADKWIDEIKETPAEVVEYFMHQYNSTMTKVV